MCVRKTSAEREREREVERLREREVKSEVERDPSLRSHLIFFASYRDLPPSTKTGPVGHFRLLCLLIAGRTTVCYMSQSDQPLGAGLEIVEDSSQALVPRNVDMHVS